MRGFAAPVAFLVFAAVLAGSVVLAGTFEALSSAFAVLVQGVF